METNVKNLNFDAGKLELLYKRAYGGGELEGKEMLAMFRADPKRFMKFFLEPFYDRADDGDELEDEEMLAMFHADPKRFMKCYFDNKLPPFNEDSQEQILKHPDGLTFTLERIKNGYELHTCELFKICELPNASELLLKYFANLKCETACPNELLLKICELPNASDILLKYFLPNITLLTKYRRFISAVFCCLRLNSIKTARIRVLNHGQTLSESFV